MTQESKREARRWLVESIRTQLLPLFLQREFVVTPSMSRVPVDREVLLSLPFGRLRRPGKRGMDLVEIWLASHRPAFLIRGGVAPKEGLMTLRDIGLRKTWLSAGSTNHSRCTPPLGGELGSL